MKDDQAPVHQLDHAEPTVIHQNPEDMTILAQWLQRAMEQGPKFWLLVAGALVAVSGLAFLTSGLAVGKADGADAWGALNQAKTVEDRIKIADAHPKTAVAGWARLLSAREEYDYGVDDLTTPGKKELAGPRLKKALDLFLQVANDAEKDSSQALGGLFGAARTLEARNELPEAIEQYKKVVEKFPDSPEAAQSRLLIKALAEPVNQAFYKELYAYTPPATPPANPGTIPGLGGIGAPGSLLSPPSSLGIGTPPATTKAALPDMTPPAGLDAPPASNAPAPAVEPPSDAAKKAEVPPLATTPPGAESPKAEVPPVSPAPPK